MPQLENAHQKTRSAKSQRRILDPWITVQPNNPNEQAPWLLSYLDVMTLLFSFFVMLFAYQKAQTNQEAHLSPKSALSSVTATSSKHSTIQHPSQSTAFAVASMKAQANLSQLAKNGHHNEPNIASTQSPDHASTTFDILTHVGRTILPDANATEIVSTKLNSVLKDETNKRLVEIERSTTEVRVDINDGILFDSGSASLNQKGETMLLKVLPVLSTNSGVIGIEGHTDGAHIGNRVYPSNWELSAARASAVTRFLIEKGVDAKRLRAIGMADIHPRDTNDTPEGRARNRRVTLTIQIENGAV